MPAFGPISRRDLVRCLIRLGFEGPFSGGKHQFMTRLELLLDDRAIVQFDALQEAHGPVGRQAYGLTTTAHTILRIIGEVIQRPTDWCRQDRTSSGQRGINAYRPASARARCVLPQSSTGRCFDIGNTTHAALREFAATGNPYAGPADPGSAGNGSIMRPAPVPMLYAAHRTDAIERSGESSRTTHGARAAVDACRYLGALLVGALNGMPKQELLAGAFYGEAAIPEGWRERLALRGLIESFADRLLALASRG